MSSHQQKWVPNQTAEDKPFASKTTKLLEPPWWQVYSALIILIGIGVVMAVNAPALLNNPWILLSAIFIFISFIMVWSYRNLRELEAEPKEFLEGEKISPDIKRPPGARE